MSDNRINTTDRAAIIEDLADAFEAFVTTDDEYGDQEFGQFCQEHHAEILSALRGQPSWLVFDKVGNPAPPSTPEREKLLELLKLSASRFRCDIGFLKGSQQIYDRLIAAIAALEGKS